MDASSSQKPESYQSFSLSHINHDPLHESPLKDDGSRNNKALSSIQNKWTETQIRHVISLCLLIISLIILIPGLWCAMIDVHIYTNFSGSRLVVASQRRGIISTVSYLFDQNRYFCGTLILIFAVVIPIVKSVLLLLMNNFRKPKYNYLIYTIIRDYGKWNMADVFAMSVFLAFLSSAFITDIEAKLLSGFYCFLAYCILSIVAARVAYSPPIPNNRSNDDASQIIKNTEQMPLTESNRLGDNIKVQDNDQKTIAMPEVADLNKLNELKSP